jgi:hypothetical protein
MSHHPEEPILNIGNASHFKEVLEKGLEQPASTRAAGPAMPAMGRTRDGPGQPPL